MATRQLDTTKAEAFADQMMGTLRGAALSGLVSLGHNTGLFDTMADLPPSTSIEIANAASLSERYVREWLGGLVTGGVVEYDPSRRTYSLPAEHAAVLTRAAGADNLAVVAAELLHMTSVEEELIECFRNGGGVPYSSFPRFQGLQAEESRPVLDATLVDVTLPLVPGLVERLTTGIDVADIGCGQGHAVNVMARAFPSSRFTGYDLSEGGIAAGRAEANEWKLANADFVVHDVATPLGDGRFDLITAFDAIHDQAQPRRVLANIHRALRPGGTFLMVDIAGSSNLEENIEHPLAPVLYTFSTFHCMTVSLALGGEGLGTMWGEQKALELLTEAGFTDVAVEKVDGDILNSYYIAGRAQARR